MTKAKNAGNGIYVKYGRKKVWIGLIRGEIRVKDVDNDRRVG